MEFVTIGSAVLALPGHSSAQTELCSWMTNFFHCSAQNSLYFGQQTEPGPTVLPMLDASSQPSWIAVDLNQHSYQELEVSGWGRNVGFPWKALASMGAVGKPSGLIYLGSEHFVTLRRKRGKLEESLLNLGPNSISSFGFWEELAVWIPWRNHWEEWTVSRWTAWIWGFT